MTTSGALTRRRMLMSPMTGPGNRIQATLLPSVPTADVAMTIEKVVNRKPMLFWIVSALPISSGGCTRSALAIASSVLRLVTALSPRST